MTVRRWSLVALMLFALTQLSCATVGLTPAPETMPAARAALPPEYRLFYDALQDYGDWTLIEPYGYVFRPYNNVVGWRPYEEGYWAASDVYGWVWISAEPFGWATYHYGDWIYDRFQGWVWIPGLDWAPAWVSWETTPDYVGWAPAFPTGFSTDLIPGGAYVYVPTGNLASPDLSTHIRTKSDLGDRLGVARPIHNPVERGGVAFNWGPRFEQIEQHSGPLPRVKIEVPPGGLGKPATKPGRTPGAGASRPAGLRKPGARPVPAGPATPGSAELDTRTAAENTRRAAEEAARRARAVTEQRTAPPESIEVVRAPGAQPAPAEPAPPAEKDRPREPRPAPGGGSWEPQRNPAEADTAKTR
jgi:hypothetical protein